METKRCPQKRGWATKDEAKIAIHREWRKPRAGPKPVRAYPCPICGKWHTTSRPYDPERRRRDREEYERRAG
jgi:hypothetical protein